MKSDQCHTFLGSLFLNDTHLIVGTNKGDLYLFVSGIFTKSIPAHKGCINSIFSNNSGFLTGGNDGNILLWDSKLTIIKSINITNPNVKSLCPRIRSVCMSSDGKILIGTRAGEIIELEGESCKVLIRSHYDEELWGICMHPKEDKFYTAGQDKLLAEWSIDKKEIIKVMIMTL